MYLSRKVVFLINKKYYRDNVTLQLHGLDIRAVARRVKYRNPIYSHII